MCWDVTDASLLQKRHLPSLLFFLFFFWEKVKDWGINRTKFCDILDVYHIDMAYIYPTDLDLILLE
jgi:hypothetical protein